MKTLTSNDLWHILRP